ncbi:phosphodiester glycosidase family protein [Deinococcus marmoris]|uniref:phosphodiester glycosidase family protein n=1 Tax=Deinococcus marmoris TaxID=249408 RepID=UPI000495EC8E|nr:phosphodiester glycosidase family protein [Deinococcus marmoris]
MSLSSRLVLPLLSLTALLSCGRSPEVQGDPYDLALLNEQVGSVAAPYDAVKGTAAQGRVRVSFLGDAPDLPAIGVRQVLLCGTACTTAGSAASVTATDDGSGRGVMFSDVAVVPGEIDRIIVQPDPKLGQAVAFKTIRLSQPIVVEAGERKEIFLSLKAVPENASSPMEVSFLGAASLPASSTTVMAYRPDRATAWPAGEAMGLAMAAGGSTDAQVFGLELQDTGGVMPRLAVWPSMKMNAPMKVSVNIDDKRLAQDLTAADYRVQLADGSSPKMTMKGNTLTFEAANLESAQLVTDRSVVETSDGQRIALPVQNIPLGAQQLSAQNTSTCKNRLISRRAEYEQFFTNGTDALRIFDCESVAPYVHIVLINRANRSRTVELPVTPSVDYPGKYVLRPITSHATGAAVAINGFTWSGDKGTAYSTGYGTPLGTLITAGTVRKTNSSTEAILGFERQAAGQASGTSAEFFVGASSSLNFGTHNYNVIGSTTSVIRSGACNPNQDASTLERWSAVGIGLNRMALVSSTSSGTSTSRDLCSVFEGLGYLNGAIRLDGGPSAAMTWNGQHINPLGGMSYGVFGNARNILNALVWK